MSYSDVMNQLMQAGYFQICVILDPNGNVYWNSNPEWQLDGISILNSWKNKEPAIIIGETRFSVIKSDYPDWLAAKSLRGGGTIIVRRAPNGYFFLTYTYPDAPIQDPFQIQREVGRMAALFK